MLRRVTYSYPAWRILGLCPPSRRHSLSPQVLMVTFTARPPKSHTTLGLTNFTGFLIRPRDPLSNTSRRRADCTGFHIQGRISLTPTSFTSLGAAA